MIDEIYAQYYDKVLGYINRKIGNLTVAEDLCSDVFLKVVEKLDTFDETKASLSTWLYTIARNRVTDYFRTRRVFEEVPETLSVEGSVEDTLLNSELLETLAAALEDMEERQRDIIILRYYSGLSLKEIAERLRISYAYVKVLQNKALASLRKSLS